MTAGSDKVQPTRERLPEDQLSEVQRLALTGYDFNHALHLVLRVKDVAEARAFFAGLLRQDRLTFGDRGRGADCAINVGLTYKGLESIGLRQDLLKELAVKAPAFREGARSRAARRMGDFGESAAERWDEVFESGYAHVLISIHATDERRARAAAQDLASSSGAQQGFEGWGESRWLPAAHLTTDRRNRKVHFGFRDNIARPVIAGASAKGGKPCHSAGEMLLGYPNDEGFNRWADRTTAEDVARFFRNGSFAVLRKIEQHEDRLDEFLEQRADALLRERVPGLSDLESVKKYLKAKLCGRWPNGARMRPGEDSEPPEPTPEQLADDSEFDFKDDEAGLGCPFGAHIRRTSPRGDPVLPLRRRPLFRRAMPYGRTDTEQRGLLGLFFCASIEDQFEHVMSEWVEKMPMGPASHGNAKDPLVGNNDDVDSFFHIPRPGGSVRLRGFAPFVTTHGTLYAFFPSRRALHDIAGVPPPRLQAIEPAPAPPGATRMQSGQSAAQAATGTTPRFDSPKDRFCDVVMEGGITSGIIYASAVTELAQHYRFRNIGGSSIGAFAAALTAAAEYARRCGASAGFEFLAEVPEDLAQEDRHGNTSLRNMFQPQEGTRRLFQIFLATLGHERAASRYLRGLAAALWQYRLPVLLAVLVTVALVLGPLVLIGLGLSAPRIPGLELQIVAMGSWTIALLLALAFSIALALFAGIAWDVRFGLVPNGFGMCRGLAERATSSEPPDLALYLYGAIQMAAGRDPKKDPPLTFKDLWEAPDSPSEVLGYSGSAAVRRSINLEVYAANLAHSRPYRFPLDDADDMGRLFFRLEEMERYFPEPIWRHLAAYARPYRPQGGSDPAATGETANYLELPHEHLPIAVAARLALSFPLLISAVPLWAIDYEPKRGQRTLSRCWMSDGGLCSNFPIHLFDSFLPKWPTFGISLQTRNAYSAGRGPVWLPDRHFEGKGDTWHRIEGSPVKQLIRFLTGLWMATWRWNDMTMMRMPAVRDRVVRVLLKEHEGGVNIRMTGQEIRNLATTYGKPAGQAFVRKFVEGSDGWPEHRWVRLNRLLIALRQQIEGFNFAARFDRYTLAMADQIDMSRCAAPLRGHADASEPRRPSEASLHDEQVGELKHLLGALSRLEAMFGEAGNHTPYEAVPRPSLRVRHPT